MLFTSEQVNEALGEPNYLTESNSYCNQDVSEQDDVEIVVLENYISLHNALIRNLLFSQITQFNMSHVQQCSVTNLKS